MLSRLIVFALCLLVPTQGWSAAAFRSASNTTYASRTNTTVTAPAGIQNGDVLLYVLFIGQTGTSPINATAPTGFVAVPGGTYPIALVDGTSFNAQCYAWYKIASSEAGDYTATHAAGSSQGAMLAISGGTGTPAATTNNGTGTTSTALGLTTSGSDALIAFIGWDWGDTANNLTAPAGSTPTFTERLDVAPLTYVATGVLAAAGTTGNKTMTSNSASGKPWGATLIAVEAAGGGGPSEIFGFRLRLVQ